MLGNYRIIGPGDRLETERMSAFVDEHPNSHFLQTPRWAQVKECWDWRGILAYWGTELVGTMSVLIRRLPLGMTILYAPRGPVCDRKDPFVMSVLLEGAQELARQQHGILLMLDADEPESDPTFRQVMDAAGFREQQNDGFDNIQAQHVIRVSLEGKTPEELLDGFPAKTRYKIRLAGRKGVKIRRYYADEPIPGDVLDAFVSITEETARRDHFIARGKEYYRGIFRALGREAVLFMAYLDGIPVAGTIGVFSGKKGWYLYGASSNTRRDAMPNYLLQWDMICYAIEQECVFWDLRGVPGKLREDDPLYGLYRFKSGFGGDYIKFTGLFVRSYRPVLARCFRWGLKTFRTLRAKYRCK